MRKRLKARRLECGLTQEQVARLTNIGRAHYAMIETGMRGTVVEKWMRIAEVLEIPASEIIEYALEGKQTIAEDEQLKKEK